MKSAFLFLSSLICFSAYSDTTMNPANPHRIDYLEASITDLQNQLAELKSTSGASAINPPAGPNLNGGCDCYVTGDLLYWKASETGLNYVIKAKSLDPATLGNGDRVAPHFDWDLGFRVGIGWNTNHDNWDLYFSWVRIHTAAHGHRHTGSHSLYSLLADETYAIAAALESSAFLKIHLNNLNLELGREFYVGKKLSMRPHVGLENIWISQHYRTNYNGHLNQPEAFNHLSFRNNFWGVGIRAGLETEWELKCGFSLIGDVAWSLLYGNFNLKRTTKINEPAVPITAKSHLDETLTQACASMEFLLGIQWDYMFAHDQFHIGWRLGWEQHVYFDQNQMFTLINPHKSWNTNGNLTFQGMTTGLRLDF